MRTILHILTRPRDALDQSIITSQQSLSDVRVEVEDLNPPEPDYQRLLEKIFSADSVQVW